MPPSIPDEYNDEDGIEVELEPEEDFQVEPEIQPEYIADNVLEDSEDESIEVSSLDNFDEIKQDEIDEFSGKKSR